MAFEHIIGQNRVKLFFQNAFDSERISHAYLFIGERGVGKEAMALELAKALLCSNHLHCHSETCSDCSRIAKLNHPDLQFIFPAPAKIKEEEQQRVIASVAENPYNRLEIWANPSISIDRIRELRRNSSYTSFEGKGRVTIIVDCEKMTTEASNALLKILEEPPEKMYLIMISSKANLLLPTITSRCQVTKFDPLSVEEIEASLIHRNAVEKSQARLTARLAAGSYRRAMELLNEDLHEIQSKALEFFRKSIQNEFMQVLFVEELLHNFQRDLKKIKDLLKLLAIWYRDAMIYRDTNGKNEDLIINYDQKEVLKNFTHKFPNADLYSAIHEIEKSLELIDRNVQINLILIVLLNKLRAKVRR
ncbi:MAG: DNA polymerase III subunit delta' [bacterium]